MTDEPLTLLGPTIAGYSLDLLARAQSSRRLCPVLGAGATCDLQSLAGVDPMDWPSLVKEVGRHLDFLGSSDSLPEHLDPQQAIDLMSRGDDQQLIEPLRRIFYPSQLPSTWPKKDYFSRSTLYLLAQITIRSALADPDRQHHAISYNFDGFLEEAIAAFGYRAIALTPNGQHTFLPARHRPSFPGKNKQRVEIRIAHPHGFLPRRGPVEARDLVFSAQSYDQRLASAMVKANIWQLVTYGTQSCLFYGFSFQDPAVRLLLRLSQSASSSSHRSIRHVALMRVNSSFSDRRWENLELDQLRRLGIVRLTTHDKRFIDQKRFLLLLTKEQERRRRRTARSVPEPGR